MNMTVVVCVALVCLTVLISVSMITSKASSKGIKDTMELIEQMAKIAERQNNE